MNRKINRKLDRDIERDLLTVRQIDRFAHRVVERDAEATQVMYI